MELLFENWYKILGLFIGLATIIVSPMVVLRWWRTRTELMEIQTFVKKNKVIREEISEINNELAAHRERIAVLETELLNERLKNITLTSEKAELEETVKDLQNLVENYQKNINERLEGN